MSFFAQYKTWKTRLDRAEQLYDRTGKPALVILPFVYERIMPNLDPRIAAFASQYLRTKFPALADQIEQPNKELMQEMNKTIEDYLEGKHEQSTQV